MPRTPVHSVDTAPQESQETLRLLEKKFGKVLNIHGEMAHSPVVLAAYAAMNAAIDEHGTFDARTREAIALAVGAVDDCSSDAEAVFAAGWDEGALHDAVSVCALFNFMNRLVEGLGVTAPAEYYTASGQRLAAEAGYAGLHALLPDE